MPATCELRAAIRQLRSEGIGARYLVVTDDIASAAPEDAAKRRGIAGDFTVFRCASTAAEEGHGLDDVERVTRQANDATRTLGVAFDGCTMPGGGPAIVRGDARHDGPGNGHPR
jgi:D-erythrulose 4-kinase